ncbi:MAG: SGNH/GDSL hydrolase family protein [Planctomycetota bacterium]
MKREDDADQLSRRQLFRSAIAAGGALTAANLLSPEEAEAAESSLKKGGVVLFQGDSITDAGRNRRNQSPNNSGALGRGYAFLLASHLLANHPTKQLKVYNRGISGHKVPDLDKRWQKDTIDLKPDILSILIGVNDIWHKLNGRYKGTVASYETGFAALLERTKKALPNTKIAVCEPFVLRCGAVSDKWFPEFDERRAAAKKVAKEAGTLWVPFQTMFDNAIKDAPPKYWAGDGVHPSVAGHALMAKEWLKVVKP